jgi:uncharacterized protein YgiB involved in biofilm formation
MPNTATAVECIVSNDVAASANCATSYNNAASENKGRTKKINNKQPYDSVLQSQRRLIFLQ